MPLRVFSSPCHHHIYGADEMPAPLSPDPQIPATSSRRFSSQPSVFRCLPRERPLDSLSGSRKNLNATGPKHLGAFHLRGIADAKMKPQIILRDIAAAAANFVQLSVARRKNRHAGANSVSVGFLAHRLEQNPVFPLAPDSPGHPGCRAKSAGTVDLLPEVGCSARQRTPSRPRNYSWAELLHRVFDQQTNCMPHPRDDCTCPRRSPL